jgi:hypothetical protein
MSEVCFWLIADTDQPLFINHGLCVDVLKRTLERFPDRRDHARDRFLAEFRIHRQTQDLA